MRHNPNDDNAHEALAKRYGINQKPVAKRKQRETVADLPTGPKEAKSTVLSIEEEAIIVAIRLPKLIESHKTKGPVPFRSTQRDYKRQEKLVSVDSLSELNRRSAKQEWLET